MLGQNVVTIIISRTTKMRRTVRIFQNILPILHEIRKKSKKFYKIKVNSVFTLSVTLNCWIPIVLLVTIYSKCYCWKSCNLINLFMQIGSHCFGRYCAGFSYKNICRKWCAMIHKKQTYNFLREHKIIYAWILSISAISFKYSWEIQEFQNYDYI